jgi:hypothetical protein
MCNTVEIKNDIEAYEFKEAFELGEFVEEAKASIEECMSYYAK